MKVLLINHFPLEGSGSGTYTKNIALHLRKRGHEVAVIFFLRTSRSLCFPGSKCIR